MVTVVLQCRHVDEYEVGFIRPVDHWQVGRYLILVVPDLELLLVLLISLYDLFELDLPITRILRHLTASMQRVLAVEEGAQHGRLATLGHPDGEDDVLLLNFYQRFDHLVQHQHQIE